MQSEHMGQADVMGSLLVLGDSLAFHGPDRPYPPHDDRLFPQVAARNLGVSVDLLARPGWTARDAWWALTKDPVAWGQYLPRAKYVLVAVGGMDALPAAVPTWLRESIGYVRSGPIRRRVRGLLAGVTPGIIQVTGGQFRQLPQQVTDHYLTRIVQGVRTWRPDVPIGVLTPAPYRSGLYPSQRPHSPAVSATYAWAQALGVAVIDIDRLDVASDEANPDGLHWSWAMHEWVGLAVAEGMRNR